MVLDQLSCYLSNMELREAVIYLFKFNNWNARTNCGICSKLAIKATERRHGRRFGVFTINFEQISHIFQVFPLLTLNK